MGKCPESLGGPGCEMGKLHLRGTRGGHFIVLELGNVLDVRYVNINARS